MKQLYVNLKWIPEFYFILVSILWFYLSVNIQHSNSVNFPAIILIVLFHMQLFMNDQKLGKILAGIVALGSMVLVVTLSQKLLDTMQFDQDSQIVVLGYGNLILLNFIMAILMYRKHKYNSELTN